MKETEEKYISILKKICHSFCPDNVSVKEKIILGVLAIIVSVLISLLRNLSR